MTAGVAGPTVTLPMYAFPELDEANAAFLAALARALRLEYGAEGSAEDTLFSQVCGYPLLTSERDRFSVLAAPCYDLPGCHGATHRSFIVVSAEARYRELTELRGSIFALNERSSNSGMNLARSAFARVAQRRPFFKKILLSGSHAESLALVASGAADVASIDCITYGLLRTHRPAAVAGCRILAETSPTPAPPFVTSSRTPPALAAALQRALARVLRDEHCASALRALRLANIVPVSQDDYSVILDLERDAAERGYASLA